MIFLRKIAVLMALFIVVFGTLFPLQIVSAQGFTGSLVPCGNDLTQGECNFCDFIQLIRNVFKFLLYLAAPVVTVLIAFAGIKLMVYADSESERDKAKTLLKDALVGFLLMILAGTIVNMILGYLVKPNQRGTYWWWALGNLDCRATRVVPNLNYDVLGIPGTNVEGVAVVTPGSTIDFTKPMGDEAILAGERKASQYDAIINSVSEKHGIPPERLKAIIVAESSGNSGAISPVGAIGLTQLMPDTARYVDNTYFGGQYLSGLSDTELKNKLIEKPNIAIELGAAYYSEALRRNGEDFTKASAYYNGGPKAMAPSRNCPGLQAWQCRYDSSGCYVNGQDIGGNCKLNQGPNSYAQTRTYVTNIDRAEQIISSKK